eukprot:scaffold87676_cov62-Phaeocystis_antarctica.AAC.2
MSSCWPPGVSARRLSVVANITMHHRRPHAPTTTATTVLRCARVCGSGERERCAGACALVAELSAYRLVPRGRGGGVGLTPIKRTGGAWRGLVAQSRSARCLSPRTREPLSQSKGWRGGTRRRTAVCACTAACVGWYDAEAGPGWGQ